MTTNKFDLNYEFNSDKVLTASESDLLRMLKQICSDHVPNDMVRHREIVRGLTINHILMQRHIDKLNAQNARTQKWVMFLAIVATVGTLAQVAIALSPPTKTAPTNAIPVTAKTICPFCSNYSSVKPPIKEQATPNKIQKAIILPRHSSAGKR